MKPVSRSQLVLWAVLALPAAFLIGSWLAGRLTYGAVVGESGEWAARLLIATLAATPLRLIFKRGPWLIWLVRRRRDLGVASFLYAAGHTVFYLVRKADLGAIVAEGLEWWLLTGWLAFFVFVPLALSSTDAAVRALRRWWKRLHRLVYLGAVLVGLHWTLAAFEPTMAYVHIGIIAMLELVRVALQAQQRAAAARPGKA